MKHIDTQRTILIRPGYRMPILQKYGNTDAALDPPKQSIANHLKVIPVYFVFPKKKYSFCIKANKN